MEVLGIVKKEFKIENGPKSIAVLLNGDLVIGCHKGKIKILDTNDDKVKQTLSGHLGCINDLIAVDESRLISASDDTTIKIWKINERSVERTLYGHNQCVLTLKMISNACLASGSVDKTIKIWNI